MPLTRRVSFKAVLQKGNRIQVPKLVRWQFKMEPSQVLRVGVKPADSFGGRERFYARMNKDGRIVIPKLTLDLLQDGEEGLVGKVLAVELEPLEDSA